MFGPVMLSSDSRTRTESLLKLPSPRVVVSPILSTVGGDTAPEGFIGICRRLFTRTSRSPLVSACCATDALTASRSLLTREVVDESAVIFLSHLTLLDERSVTSHMMEVCESRYVSARIYIRN